MSIGIFIGRNEAEIAVADFTGEIIDSMTVQYENAADIATPGILYEKVTALATAADALSWQRHVGIGIAADESLLRFYSESSDGNDTGMSAQPLSAQLAKRFDVPVHCINDIRAACLAEMTLGDSKTVSNVLYLSIGLLFGSGIILEGRLIGKEANLSSGLHRLPVAVGDGGMLGEFASLRRLSDAVRDAGHQFPDERRLGFPNTRDIFDRWRADAVQSLAIAIRAATATIPLDSIVLDSRLRDADLQLLIAELCARLRTDLHGESFVPEIVGGKFGTRARAVGTAMVPFYKMFGPQESEKRERMAKKDVA